MLNNREIISMMAKLIKLYENIENDLLLNIAKRLSTSDSIMPDTVLEWQMKKLEQLGSLRKDNIQIISKYSKKAIKEIDNIIRSAGFKSLELDEKIYNKAHKKGMLKNKPLPIIQSPVLKQILVAAIDNAKKEFNLVNSRALESSKKGFLEIINQVYLETSLGIYDYNTSIRKAVRNLADKGITGVTYVTKNGIRRNHIDVVVRRAILTSSSQTAGKMQEKRAEEWGSNLVEVTSHSGSRPEHAKWQGKIYSLKGETKEYPNLEKVTGYGKADGLKGINCKHDFYPFFEGISEQTYKPYDLEENKKVYEESQNQRYLEREIRKQKRRILMSEEIGDKELEKKSQLKLKERERELKSFLKETGRTKRSNRQQVVGFSHSQASKATWADKKNRRN